MGISLEQALKRCDFRGVRTLPLIAPSYAFRRLKRLIGLLERAVNQALGGKGFGRRELYSYQAHMTKLHLAECQQDAVI